MIEIKPTGVQINMSIEDAKALSLYLKRSSLKTLDSCYSNPCASEAEAGNEESKKAMLIRQTLIGCFDKMLTKAVEDYSDKNWNNAARKYL